MVVLIYGDREINLEKSKFLSYSDQRLLLDGKLVLKSSIDLTEQNDVRKAYYYGCLFEVFKANYEDLTNAEIYALMTIAYPIFINQRQLQNILAEYFNLKEVRDVFIGD